MKKALSTLALTFICAFTFAQTFSNITTNSMTFTFPGGNVMVVMRANGGPVGPTNGFTSYTGNSFFGAGSNLGGGTYAVVYGSAGGVNVTNLVANTSYTIYVYSYTYNVFSGYSYYYVTGGTHYTLTTEPLTSASGATVTNVTPTTAKLSWTNGSGTYRIATLAPGAVNSNKPVDGSYYFASTYYGSGDPIGSSYAIYNNSGNTTTMSNLSPGTVYTASVFEYNGTSGANNYRTASYTTVTFTTPASEPTTPANTLSFTNVTGTSMTVNWNNGDGATRLVGIKQGAGNKSAIELNGSNHIDVANKPAVNAGTSSFTIEAWFKTSTTGKLQSIVAKTDAVSSWSTGYRLIVGTTNTLYYEVTGNIGGIGNSCYNTCPTTVTDGLWHHVALVVDRTTGTSCALYLDGVVESTATNVSATGSTDNAFNFKIGASYSSSVTTTNYFTGQLDEVRIWNVARSSALIQNNMFDNVPVNNPNLTGIWKLNDGDTGGSTAVNLSNSNGIDGKLINFSDTTGATTFTKAPGGWVISGSGNTSPVDQTGYTANSTFGNGTLIAGNYYVLYTGSNNSVNISGLTPATTYNIYVFEYNGSNTTANYLTSTYAIANKTTASNEPTIPSSNITFSNITNNSVTATWSIGNGSNSMVSVRAGKEQTGLAFDGTNDSVAAPHNTSMNSYPLTVSAWVKTTQKTYGYVGLVNKYQLGSWNGYMLYLDGGSVHAFYGKDPSNYTWIYANSNDSVADGNWHHIAYTVDYSGSKIYIDGVLRSSTPWVGSAGACTTTQHFTLGSMAGGNLFNGQLDEVSTWSYAMNSYSVSYYMNRSLYGNEGSLTSYWKLDEGASASSSVITNSALNNVSNGTLYNFSSTAAATNFTNTSGWVYSGAVVNLPLDQNLYGYYGSSTFTYGSILGNKYYVVYSGPSNTVTVTGLSPNTTYNFDVLEFNGTPPNENYLTSTYATKNVTTSTIGIPTITSFAPANGPVGTVVTITGTNFNTTASLNTVFFGATKAIAVSATATQLVVVVPNGASFHPIEVTNNNLTGYSAQTFIVTQSCPGAINLSSFNLTNSLASYGNVNAQTLADFDSDGLVDVLTVDTSTYYVSTFRNTSTGGNISFATRNLVSNKYRPSAIAVDDLDGDGKLDIIVASKGANTIALFKCTSPAGYIYFNSAIEYNTLAAPISIATGDVDLDGKPDIIVGYSNDSISVFRNTSSNSYLSLATRVDKALPAGTTAAKVAVADIDGDALSQVDIVAACSGSTNQLTVFRNTSTSGNVTLVAPVNYNPSASGAINALAIGRINNDTKNDIVIGHGTSGISVVKNNSTPGIITLAFGTTLTALASTPADIAINDLDGDNFPDLTVGYKTISAGSSISVFENTSTASFTFNSKIDYAIGTNPTPTVAVADLDNDGKSDIVVGSGTTNVSVFHNEMNGTLSGEPSTVASSLSAAATITTSALTWTNGNGTGRLVIVRPATATAVAPFDGIDYSTVNSVYGSGQNLGGGNYVVYKGTGNAVTVTGLSSNTLYYYNVYEFQGSGCNINYLTTGTIWRSFTTNNIPPAITAIANPASICQSSGLQTINMTGITDGGEGNQTITVYANSSNTTLISTVTVNYTSPNTTGSLTYTPTPGQYGTSTITVTLYDSGSNNYIKTITFTVTVDPLPPAAVAGTNQLTLCSNTATLGATNPGSPYTGTWSFLYKGASAAVITNPNSPTSTVTGISIGDSLRLRWTVNSGACASTTNDVSVKRISCAISADFKANKTNVCTGSSVNFTDLSATQSGSLTNWAWNFGDPGSGVNNTSASTNPSHTYSSVGTYTVSLTVTNSLSTTSSVTKNAFITVVGVPNAATTITGVSPVCAGANNVLYAHSAAIIGADKYAWTLPSGASITSGDSTASIYVNFGANAISGNVIVSGKNMCGLGTSSSFPVTVKPLPGAAGTITGAQTVCEGALALPYSVPTITNTTGYTWDVSAIGAVIASGQGTKNITLNFPVGVVVSGDISVYGTNANGCGNGATATLHINITTVPGAAGAISGQTAISSCPLVTGATYSIPLINNAATYTWTVPSGVNITSGNTTNSITVNYTSSAVSGNITVMGVNTCGNGTQATLPVTVQGPLQQSICLVTVDTTSKYNVITWQKPISANIDSFVVYREVAGNGYVRVGKQLYSKLSQFADTLYVPKADPNTTNFRYKVTVLDSCHNESNLSQSNYHGSIFLQANVGVAGAINLNWIQYSGATVSMYRILRDSTATGQHFAVIDSVPGSNSVYTDYPPTSSAFVLYKLETIWNLSCSAPNMKTTAIVKSISNIKNMPAGSVTGIDPLLLDKEIRIYPNPANGLLNIDYPDAKQQYTFTIHNMIGQVLTEIKSDNNATGAYKRTQQIDVSTIPAGVYMLNITLPGAKLTKKLVVN
jgi:hypothetical protein